MDWDIWSRKLVLGSLTSAGVVIVAVLVGGVTDLQHQEKVPAWVLIVSPFVLHFLGQAQNWLKHRNDPKLPA